MLVEELNIIGFPILQAMNMNSGRFFVFPTELNIIFPVLVALLKHFLIGLKFFLNWQKHLQENTFTFNPKADYFLLNKYTSAGVCVFISKEN